MQMYTVAAVRESRQTHQLQVVEILLRATVTEHVLNFRTNSQPVVSVYL